MECTHTSHGSKQNTTTTDSMIHTPTPPVVLKEKKKGCNGATKDAGTATSSKHKKKANTKQLIDGKISQLQADSAGDEELEKQAEMELDQLVQSLSGLQISARSKELKHRNQLLLTEYKKIQRDILAAYTAVDQITHDQESAAVELANAKKKKNELERICREMRALNATAEAENENIPIQEEARRQEQMKKLQTHTDRIAEQINKDRESNEKFATETEGLRKKMKQFLIEAEGQEEKYQKTILLMEQRNEAFRERLQHQKKATEDAIKTERLATEQQAIKYELIKDLQSHLSADTSRYKDLMASLEKSSLDQFEPHIAEINEVIKKENSDIAFYRKEIDREKKMGPELIARRDRAEEK
eukprot:Ihof_evm1s878 gene=Ihof_evmTU1s878